MTEIWKDIEGYEGRYQVSNLGRIKCLKRTYRDRSGKLYFKETNKILKGNPNTRGYLSVRLYNDKGENHYKIIHPIVARAFIPNPKHNKIVDHINRDKTDNRASNLRWVTESENMRNKKDNIYLKYKGETKLLIEWAKVTQLPLETIYRRYKSGWSAEEILLIPKCSNGYDSKKKRLALKKARNDNGRNQERRS